MTDPLVLTGSVGADIPDRSETGWWLTVTGETAARVVGRAGTMTGEAADTYPASPIQGNAMTKRTGVGNVTGPIVVRGTRVNAPGGRMGVIDTVAALATAAADSDIEPGVAPRTTCISMASLADGQVLFGNWAMDSTIQICAVQRVCHNTRPCGMTIQAIGTG